MILIFKKIVAHAYADPNIEARLIDSFLEFPYFSETCLLQYYSGDAVLFIWKEISSFKSNISILSKGFLRLNNFAATSVHSASGATSLGDYRISIYQSLQRFGILLEICFAKSDIKLNSSKECISKFFFSFSRIVGKWINSSFDISFSAVQASNFCDSDVDRGPVVADRGFKTYRFLRYLKTKNAFQNHGYTEKTEKKIFLRSITYFCKLTFWQKS